MSMAHLAEKIHNARTSNTALKSHPHGEGVLAAHCDWMTLKFSVRDKYVLDKAIEDIKDILLIDYDFGTQQYTANQQAKYQSYRGTLGSCISYTYGCNIERINCIITLPGQWLKAHSLEWIKESVRFFHEKYDTHCSRFDIAVDDYQRKLNWSAIRDACKSGCGVGFREYQFIESKARFGTGKTIYLGTRKSARYCRIYDRASVTDGKENCIRFEIEFKKDLSHTVYIDYLYSSDINGAETLSGIIQSQISFVKRKDKNLNRATTLVWWQNFINRIKGQKIELPRTKPILNIERTLRWVHRNVSKGLLLLKEAIGIDDLNVLFGLWELEARGRITKLDLIHLDEFKEHGLSIHQLMSEF
jgi:DNA relaxase NicK